MEKKRSDHYLLGYEHRAWGLPRYKFQDPALQEEYNKGFDNFGDVDSDSDDVVESLRGKPMPPSFGKGKDKW
jgi:hypothetical protein